MEQTKSQTLEIGAFEVRTRSLRWYIRNTITGEEIPVVGNKGAAIQKAEQLDKERDGR